MASKKRVEFEERELAIIWSALDQSLEFSNLEINDPDDEEDHEPAQKSEMLAVRDRIGHILRSTIQKRTRRFGP